MKRFLKQNLILLLILVVGLGAAAVSLVNRAEVESKDKTYDIVIDLPELEKMAAQSEHDALWWLKEWKQFGINKVGLYEDNLEDLAKEFEGVFSNATIYAISEANPNWKESFPDYFMDKVEGVGFDEYDLITCIGDEELYDYVVSRFRARYPELLKVSVFTDGTGYILFDGNEENALYKAADKTYTFDAKALTEYRVINGSLIAKLNIGFREEVIEKYTSIGYSIVPRTIAYEGYNGEEVAEDIFRVYDEMLPEDSAYLIVGGRVFGYDDASDACYEYLTTHDTSLCLIEDTTQLSNMEGDGLDDLATRLGNRVIRTFSVWNYIQYRYAYFGYEGPEEVQNTFYRAVTERNIRMIYYKPMKETDEDYVYITDPDDYEMVFTDLAERLEKHNFSIGTATPAEELSTPLALQILMTFGSVAAAVLLLTLITDITKRWSYILTAIGMLCVLGAFYFAPNLSRSLAGLAAALIWPCIACVMYFMLGRKYFDAGETPRLGRTILRGTSALVGGSLLALVGGLTAAAPFSDNLYLVEQAAFRGIKVSQILPMLFAVLVYMAWFGFRPDKKKIGRLEVKDFSSVFMLDIKVWMAAVVCILGGVAAIYIIRTGHTTNANTNVLEVQFRNALEYIFPARPRTKEFLISFPCLLLFVYACERRQKFFCFCFGFMSVIGFGCIANTYMHLRTPLYISLERLAASLPLGIFIGIVYVLIFHGLTLFWNRHIKERL